MTPSAAGFAPPGTPGTGLDSFSSYDWMSNGIEVMVKESIPEPGLRRQIGEIRNVLIGSCAVYLIQQERTVNILSEYLVPSLPRTGDKVKVVTGEYREQVGVIRSVEGQDAVVEFEATRGMEREIKFFPLTFLCKVVADMN